MSYDITISLPGVYKCVRCSQEVKPLYFNITYNVAPMFAKAFNNDQGINSLDKKTCTDVINILKDVLAELRNNPQEYVKLNPTNGWGSYEGVVEFIKNLLAACIEHPGWEISID